MRNDDNTSRFIKMVIVVLAFGTAVAIFICGKMGLLTKYGFTEVSNAETVEAAESEDVTEEGVPSQQAKLLSGFHFGESMDTENKKQVYGNRKVLVIVPHEDDDINLCGGMLEQYVEYASDIYVTFVTNGDYYDKAATRLQEAVNVLTAYGIPEDHIIFLGYGDKWYVPYGSIYYAPEGEVATSHNNKTETYGTGDIQPFRQETYTREHLLTDIEDVIKEIQPNTIFCNDYDDHSDHKAVSLLFEEAMGNVLKENTAYQPEVYKGFCYFAGWRGRPDYEYSENIISSYYEGSNMEDNPIYLWAGRVRFPVSEESVPTDITQSRTYQALSGYASQDATDHAESVINGDRVFWQRRTDNLCLTARMEVSSGDASVLQDFKLMDSSDILADEYIPDLGIWKPDAADEKKEITVTFDQPVKLSEVVLYDNPSPTDNVKNAEITFSDGTVEETGALEPFGSASKTIFAQKENIMGMTIRLTDVDGEEPGLIEAESYTNTQQGSVRTVKFMDEEGNFSYWYHCDETGTAVFQVYQYPYGISGHSASADKGADLSNYHVVLKDVEGGHVGIADDKIYVDCPKGSNGVLLLMDRDETKVLDAISISMP